jgi:demethylmenaquinone methyltransferase / 2-methoxy-6-polyprenyl-1,4-benzoquinol methylase
MLEMMAPPEKQDSRLMRDMFGTIAPRYDFVTQTFSFGMDRRWKRLGVERAVLREDAAVLDLASGTGDFSKLVLQRFPRARAIGLDITEGMLRRARERGLKDTVCGDANRLPFPDASFDCVFIGYGLRNLPNLDVALREVGRVTRPGGLLVSLDFFLPANHRWKQFYLGYLYIQGCFWGAILHGRPRLYTYIPDSLRSFMSIGEFFGFLKRAGYVPVDMRAYFLGGIGLQWAVKSNKTMHQHSPLSGAVLTKNISSLGTAQGV